MQGSPSWSGKLPTWPQTVARLHNDHKTLMTYRISSHEAYISSHEAKLHNVIGRTWLTAYYDVDLPPSTLYNAKQQTQNTSDYPQTN